MITADCIEVRVLLYVGRVYVSTDSHWVLVEVDLEEVEFNSGPKVPALKDPPYLTSTVRPRLALVSASINTISFETRL
jgi:hypothetical protein